MSTPYSQNPFFPHRKYLFTCWAIQLFPVASITFMRTLAESWSPGTRWDQAELFLCWLISAMYIYQIFAYAINRLCPRRMVVMQGIESVYCSYWVVTSYRPLSERFLKLVWMQVGSPVVAASFYVMLHKSIVVYRKERENARAAMLNPKYDEELDDLVDGETRV